MRPLRALIDRVAVPLTVVLCVVGIVLMLILPVDSLVVDLVYQGF